MINLTEGQEFDGHYQLIRLIDTGGYAEVWEAKYLVAGNTVALKIYPRLDEEGAATIEGEYNKLFELQHSNLVNALHFGKFQGYPYLVMRYYPGGNASGKIGDCHEAEVAKILVQIGGVLKYLHSNDIVHQDIKPNNFLLDQRGNYYLADLGLSLKVRSTIRRQTVASGSQTGSMLSSKQTGLTPTQYRAPELFDQQRSQQDPIKATDIWALGASLYEMMTGRPPFGELGGLMQKEGYSIERLPAVYSDQVNFLIGECLAREAWDRPTASKVEKRAQAFLDTGNWYEPEEWKELMSKSSQKQSRDTIRQEEEKKDGGGQGGGSTDRGFGGQGGATDRGYGGGATDGGFGGGQGFGGGGQGGGQEQGGSGGGQQRNNKEAIEKEDKKNFRIGFIAVGVAVVVIVIFFVMANKKHPNGIADIPKIVDSPIVKAADTPAFKGVTPSDGTNGGGTGGAGTDKAKGIDGGTTGGGDGGTNGRSRSGGEKTGNGGTSGGEKTGGATAANYLDVKDPVIDDKPDDNCQPRLTRIVRNGSTLKVYLFVPPCSSKLSLYGPGDQRALFVRQHGVKTVVYPLTNISWTGVDENIPAGGLRVTATFECPPDYATLLDIREDRGRLDQGLSFITFNGVHLQ